MKSDARYVVHRNGEEYVEVYPAVESVKSGAATGSVSE